MTVNKPHVSRRTPTSPSRREINNLLCGSHRALTSKAAVRARNLSNHPCASRASRVLLWLTHARYNGCPGRSVQRWRLSRRAAAQMDVVTPLSTAFCCSAPRTLQLQGAADAAEVRENRRS